MALLNPIKQKLSEKLQDWTYFPKFFDERTRDELAAQLRELRALRGMSQVKFAAESGMKQSAVSRIEQSEYSGWTYKTLLRAATTLKARLKIEFIPAERVIAEYKNRETEQAARRGFLQMTDAASGTISGSTASDNFSSGPEAAASLRFSRIYTNPNIDQRGEQTALGMKVEG